MKTKLILGIAFAIIFLSPAYASLVGVELSDSEIEMNIGQSDDFSLRLVHTNESENLTIPIHINYVCAIPMDFDKTDFNLLTSENIYVNVSVSSNHYFAGNYPGTVFVQAGSEMHELDFNIKILPTENYTFTSNMTRMFRQGEKGVIHLNLTNLGNTEVEINLSVPDPFYSPKKIMLPVDSVVEIPFFYDFPENFTSGTKIFEFRLNNNTFTLNSTIKDSVCPNYTYEFPKEVYVGTTHLFEFTCKDNEKLQDSYYVYGGEKNNLTEEFYFGEVKDYAFVFVCQDNFNNTNNKSITIPSVQIPLENLSTSFEFPRKKKEETINYRLFHLPQKMTFKVKMTESDSVGGFTARIVSDESSVVLEKNKTIEALFGGNVMLSISDFKNDGNYSIHFDMEFSNWSETEKVGFDFSGRIGGYSVMNEKNISILGRNSICYGVDKGSFDESYIECLLRYSIDTDPAKLTYPITEFQLETNNNLCEEKISNLTDKKDGWIFILYIVIAVLLIVGTLIFIAALYRQYG